MKHTILLLFTLTLWSCNTPKKELAGSFSDKDPVTRLPYFNSADFTPQWEKGIHRIPDFSFINQNGKEITNNTYKGKIYIADFFFTICPGICPKLTKNMYQLQEAYGKDDQVMLLSHSVMPWVDTVETLKEYAKNNRVDPAKWNLVTGNKEQLYEIAREGYFADEDFTRTQDENKFIHTENFILVDGEGFIRGVYNGTLEIEVQRLMRHIEILKKES
ncbi:SCO family protein [Leptobacterium flavescens]|uniref:SCO family protein n=1 Tax=Leptobacterium flavescens TaxID=472055 RepID=A0A6P0UMB7_9FLAO|nr:SCO family protein [Leptobacterium flavescens]NER14157.1 SCO family protein [Leptobacterium flavescens]